MYISVNFILILFYFFLLLTISKILYKKFKIEPYFFRRMIHIISAISIFFLAIFLGWQSVFYASVFFSFIFIIFIRTQIFDFLNVNINKTGIVTFPVSISLVSIIFAPISVNIFYYSILLLGLSDGVAGLGRYFKNRNPIIFNGKTIFGSILFMVSTFIITLIFASIYIENIYILVLLSILFSLILTFTELFTKGGYDNITVVLVSAILMYNLI